jgi:hypothetical protein
VINPPHLASAAAEVVGHAQFCRYGEKQSSNRRWAPLRKVRENHMHLQFAVALYCRGTFQNFELGPRRQPGGRVTESMAGRWVDRPTKVCG